MELDEFLLRLTSMSVLGLYIDAFFSPSDCFFFTLWVCANVAKMFDGFTGLIGPEAPPRSYYEEVVGFGVPFPLFLL